MATDSSWPYEPNKEEKADRLLPPVRVAVFTSEGIQVSEWYPLNADGSTPQLRINRSGVRPEFRLEDEDGLIAQVPVFEDVMTKFSEGESFSAQGFRYD